MLTLLTPFFWYVMNMGIKQGNLKDKFTPINANPVIIYSHPC